MGKVRENGQYALFCGPPCVGCRQPTGWVSSKSQRYWNDTRTRKAPRANVSDLVFEVNGKRVPAQQLPAMHDELFSQPNGTFCPGSALTGDHCQPVAKLPKGDHKI